MTTVKMLTVAVFLLILPGIVLAQQEAGNGGKALYNDYCAGCHGLDAKGKGPIAPLLTIPTTDLTQLTKKNNGTFPALRVARVIDGRDEVRAHGTPEMPLWGREFTRQEAGTMGTEKAAVSGRAQALVAYLNSIQE